MNKTEKYNKYCEKLRVSGVIILRVGEDTPKYNGMKRFKTERKKILTTLMKEPYADLNASLMMLQSSLKAFEEARTEKSYKMMNQRRNVDAKINTDQTIKFKKKNDSLHDKIVDICEGFIRNSN